MKRNIHAQNATFALAIQKGSHSIAKMKPKVQILHTQASAAVEIEPANFQTYVQSHTGKSTELNTELTKPESSKNTTFALAVHKGSHSIAKLKPKVRIVHIPTPEVVKIEPISFQKIVQSLTGKSIRTKTKLKEEEPIILCDESSNSETDFLNVVHSSFESKERSITGEKELTSWENLGEESLIGFEDLDKFINELIDFLLSP